MRKVLIGVVLLVLAGFVLQAQTVTVNKPALNETWVKGQAYTITWTKSGTMGNQVRISLRNAATLAEVALIQDNVTNSGAYQWTVPAATADGSYKVRVKVKDAAIQDDSDAFSIAASAPPAGTITVTKPALNETWVKGQSYSVNWTKSGSLPANVAISLIDAAAVNVIKTIAASAPNSGTYGPWTVPADVVVGSYKVRVKAEGANIQDDSDTFNIAATPSAPGTITVTNPAANDNWVYYGSTGGQVQWTTSGTAPAPFKISLMDAGGTSVVRELGSNLVCCSFGIAFYPSYAPPGAYRVRVASMGNGVFGLSPVFNISPNYIHLTSPQAGSRVSVGKTHTITWERVGFEGNQVQIQLLTEHNQLLHTLTPGTPNNGSFIWAVPQNTPFGKYYLYISVVGGYVDNKGPMFNVSPEMVLQQLPIKK